MLIPESHVRIWLYAPPTDMRKSFDGLSALVKMQLNEEPSSGQLFVFINHHGGYCVWAKRFEQGQLPMDLIVTAI